MTPGEAIDQASREYAPNDEQFRLIMHAIAMSESGGNPNIVGDNGQSIGLYQNRMVYGRGGSYSKDQLLDPLFNSRLAAKELYQVYKQGIKNGLSGKQLAIYVSKYGQRPAPGNELAVGKHYGEYVAGSPGPVVSKPVPNPVITPEAPQKTWQSIFDTYIKQYLKPFQQVQAFEPSPQMFQPTNLKLYPTPYYPTFSNQLANPVNRAIASSVSPSYSPTVSSQGFASGLVPGANQYTVKSGDTLWDIAARTLGSGTRWKELGYTGDPTKMPVGTVLNVPSGSASTSTSSGYAGGGGGGGGGGSW